MTGCAGSGELVVPVEQDRDSGQWHVEYEPCPGCDDCMSPADMDYERAQSSIDWEERHGGGL